MKKRREEFHGENKQILEFIVMILNKLFDILIIEKIPRSNFTFIN